MILGKSSNKGKGCDIGGAKELGVIYFPTNWGAKEHQNLPNHRVEIDIYVSFFTPNKNGGYWRRRPPTKKVLQVGYV